MLHGNSPDAAGENELPWDFHPLPASSVERDSSALLFQKRKGRAGACAQVSKLTVVFFIENRLDQDET